MVKVCIHTVEAWKNQRDSVSEYAEKGNREDMHLYFLRIPFLLHGCRCSVVMGHSSKYMYYSKL